MIVYIVSESVCINMQWLSHKSKQNKIQVGD